jgi:hypothetical protein
VGYWKSDDHAFNICGKVGVVRPSPVTIQLRRSKWAAGKVMQSNRMYAKWFLTRGAWEKYRGSRLFEMGSMDKYFSIFTYSCRPAEKASIAFTRDIIIHLAHLSLNVRVKSSLCLSITL